MDLTISTTFGCSGNSLKMSTGNLRTCQEAIPFHLWTSFSNRSIRFYALVSIWIVRRHLSSRSALQTSEKPVRGGEAFIVLPLSDTWGSPGAKNIVCLTGTIQTHQMRPCVGSVSSPPDRPLLSQTFWHYWWCHWETAQWPHFPHALFTSTFQLEMWSTANWMWALGASAESWPYGWRVEMSSLGNRLSHF